MNNLGLASAMGVPPISLASLLKGEVTHHIGARVGAITMSVQAFINGDVRPGMAQALGTSTASAQALRNSLDRKGAIGVVIGLCIAAPRRKAGEPVRTAGVTSADLGSLGSLDSLDTIDS